MSVPSLISIEACTERDTQHRGSSLCLSFRVPRARIRRDLVKLKRNDRLSRPPNNHKHRIASRRPGSPFLVAWPHTSSYSRPSYQLLRLLRRRVLQCFCAPYTSDSEHVPLRCRRSPFALRRMLRVICSQFRPCSMLQSATSAQPHSQDQNANVRDGLFVLTNALSFTV